MTRNAKVYCPTSEAALVDALCAKLPEFLGKRAATWSIEHELVVGDSIADLIVVLERDGEQPYLPKPLSVAESVILSGLRRNGAIRLDQLEQQCGLNGRTSRIVSRLIELGLIKRMPGGRVSAVRRCWGTRTLLAVEAKLLRWRDALTQANSYRRYADESYVALPEFFAEPALAAIDQFRLAGVGLLIVSGRGIRKAIIAARSREHDWRREFAYSRLTSVRNGSNDCKYARCAPAGASR